MTFYPRDHASWRGEQPARLVCDDCGITIVVDAEIPPPWYVAETTPPRWELSYGHGHKAIHRCPSCKIAVRVRGLR